MRSRTDLFQTGSKYPPVSGQRARSRYAAVFQDQYSEFSELQRDVGASRAKLQQLEALLLSLPPPRSQVSPGGPMRMTAFLCPSEPPPLLALSEGGSSGSSCQDRVGEEAVGESTALSAMLPVLSGIVLRLGPCNES